MLRSAQLYLAATGLAVMAGTAPGHAFDDLDKGKSPQALFRTNCAICHRSVRGLGASMGSWTLSGFLTEHYTTSKTAANTLANYLIAVGKPAAKTRPRRRRTPAARKRKAK